MHGDKIALYQLIRKQDVHGISGTGVVALIAVMPSGRAIMEWTASNHPTLTIFANIQEIELIHGHGGASVVKLVKEEKPLRKKKNAQ